MFEPGPCIFDYPIMECSTNAKYLWFCLIALSEDGQVFMTTEALARRVKLSYKQTDAALSELIEEEHIEARSGLGWNLLLGGRPSGA